MKDFNEKAIGLPQHNTKQAHLPEKTMIEKEQPVPILKPDGGLEVDRQAFKSKLNQEHEHVKRLNEKAQRLYKQSLRDVQQQSANEGRSRLSFNRQSSIDKQAIAQDKLVPEQKAPETTYEYYIKLLDEIERLSKISDKLQRSAQTLFQNMEGRPHIMRAAQDISEGVQLAAQTLAARFDEKRKIDKLHPEFKDKARVFGKALTQKRDTQRQHDF